MSSWYQSPTLAAFVAIFDRNLVQRQNALLWVLTISTEHQRPLGPMLEALAVDERSHSWSRRLRHLTQHLNAGMPLPDALERIPGLLPPDVSLAIRVGTETGTLPAMLKESAKEFSEHHDEVYATWKGSLVYLAALLMTLFSVAGFVMTYIVPKIKYIFNEFGTELPALTRFIIDVSDEIVCWSPVLIGGVFAGLAWIAWMTRHGTPSGLFRWFMFSHSRTYAPTVLRILSVVVREGRPIAGAFSTMARHCTSHTVRNQLLYIRNEVERGNDVWGLLFEMSLLMRSEARILEAAGRAGNLPWALKEMAERIERDTDYRTMLILEILRPTILVVVAGIVGVFVIGLFLPLIKLINDLS